MHALKFEERTVQMYYKKKRWLTNKGQFEKENNYKSKYTKINRQ